MPTPLPTKPQKAEHIIFAVFEEDVADMIAALKPVHAGFLETRSFTGKAGSLVVVPSGLGSNEMGSMWAWFGLGPRKTFNPLAFRALATQLPRGKWRLKVDHDLDLAAIHVAWGLGSYSFGKYKASSKPVEAVLEDTELTPSERTQVALEVQAHDRARDLVNTPANDMGPAQIEAVARGIAKAHGAEVGVISGELLAKSYPAVHAVGRAAGADQQPRFIEIAWQPKEGRGPLPVVCLVGKGVAFDTGGLNIKTGNGMGLMKKDMGGAAAVIAATLAAADLQLPVRITTLAPLAENAISGSAYRPGDVITQYDGTTVETTNSDAEGRLVLADALGYAVARLQPDIVIDLATLTGANAVALGKRTAALYSHDDTLAEALVAAGAAAGEQMFRLPLPEDYVEYLHSDIADLHSSPSQGAGSVVAALFLREFLGEYADRWAHLDMSAPSWIEKSEGELTKGATGWGVRTLVRYLSA